jgi:hypothetical protein
LDCEFIFTREEWQAVHIAVNQTALPSSPPSLGEMLSMIAHLGGHLGRKHDGPWTSIHLDWITKNARFCADF